MTLHFRSNGNQLKLRPQLLFPIIFFGIASWAIEIEKMVALAHFWSPLASGRPLIFSPVQEGIFAHLAHTQTLITVQNLSCTKLECCVILAKTGQGSTTEVTSCAL